MLTFDYFIIFVVCVFLIHFGYDTLDSSSAVRLLETKKKERAYFVLITDVFSPPDNKRGAQVYQNRLCKLESMEVLADDCLSEKRAFR